jgi:hypothetical protein
MTDTVPVLNQLNIVAKDFDKTLEFFGGSVLMYPTVSICRTARATPQ